MKAIKDGKKGVTSINQATKEAIDEAAAQCIAAAESSVPDEAEQIAPFTAKAEYKTGVFEPDLDKLFDRIEEFMSQTKKEYPKVILEQLISDYEHSEKLYMNTNGTSHDLSGVDGRNGVILAVKDTSGALMYQHLGGHGGLLHHAAVGGQIALQNGDAAGPGVGIFDGADEVRIPVHHALQILRQRFAGAGSRRGRGRP